MIFIKKKMNHRGGAINWGWTHTVSSVKSKYNRNNISFLRQWCKMSISVFWSRLWDESWNNIYMEMNRFFFFPEFELDRWLRNQHYEPQSEGLKMVSSLTRSIEWLSCLAAVQFYLLELLGDRNVLTASVFWEMMRAMNEIPSSVTCYLLSTLLSHGSMKKKKKQRFFKKWAALWEATKQCRGPKVAGRRGFFVRTSEAWAQRNI